MNEPVEADSQTSNPSSSIVEFVETSRRRFRWKAGVIILLISLTVILSAWNFLGLDRTYQVFAMWVLVPASTLAMLVWWLLVSGLAWRWRLAGLALLVGVFACLRVDDYTGDMTPLVSFRWQQTREERAGSYFSQVAPTAVPAPVRGAEVQQINVGAGDWPEFRGAERDGVVRGVSLAREWKTQAPREIWKHPVGLGWSSFAVVDGRVYTQEQRGDEEVVSCWDLDDGTPQWVHADPTRFSEAMGGVGPRATPTFARSRIFTLGATGLLNCLDAASGRRLWHVDVLDDTDAKNLNWAMAGSPLVLGDRVTVSAGGSVGSIVAYDAGSGERTWSGGRRTASYAAPRLATIGETDVILLFGGDGLGAHDVTNGKELWHFPWTNGPKVNAALPVAVTSTSVLITSGYGQGSAVLNVGGAGQKPELAWKSRQLKSKFNDPVVRDGFVYGLDEGILVCLDLATGKRRWKRGRYGYGQLLLVEDLLLVLAEKGSVAMVEATPEKFRELGRFEAISGKTWNHPVLVGDRLLVRNAAEMACFELPLR